MAYFPTYARTLIYDISLGDLARVLVDGDGILFPASFIHIPIRGD